MQRKILRSLLLVLLFTSCAVEEKTEKGSSFGPEVLSDGTNSAPERVLSAFPRLGLGPMLPQIPSYHGGGRLLASWSPNTNFRTTPTFVILHGGGSIFPMHLQMAKDFQREFNSNILILDSHWSRGRRGNTGEAARNYQGRLNATHRAYDLIAAGRWLQEKGVDIKRSFVVGESQGGYVAMRAVTSDLVFAEEIKALFAGAIALWPACHWWEEDHSSENPAGPYNKPVLIFSGGKDYGSPIEHCQRSAIAAADHIHWADATHAWMITTHGPFAPREDGNCAAKTYVRNQAIDMCFSEARTRQTFEEIRSFIKRISPTQ